MKKISFTKITLVALVIAILGLGLSGCLTPPIITTGTVKLVVSGTYYYNLKMDGTIYHSNKSSGTYYITNVPAGNHFFEAVDIDGPSWGYDSETAYISAGTTTTVYLNPTSTVTTGTVYLVVSGTYYYNLKMDGITKFSNKPPGTYVLTNVPIGNHFFEAVDIDGPSWGYDSETKYIYAGSNYVYLSP